MKQTTLIFIVTLFSCSFLTLATEEKGTNKKNVITQENLSQQQLLKNKQSFVLLDVRTAEEYSEGHIKDAINISHEKILESPEILSNYKDETLVIYCRSGRRANLVMNALKNSGYKNLFHLEGDMNQWKENNLPLVINNKNE